MALLLGLTRKHVSALNSTASAGIYSLHYFLPLLEEVAETEVTGDRAPTHPCRKDTTQRVT